MFSDCLVSFSACGDGATATGGWKVDLSFGIAVGLGDGVLATGEGSSTRSGVGVGVGKGVSTGFGGKVATGVGVCIGSGVGVGFGGKVATGVGTGLGVSTGFGGLGTTGFCVVISVGWDGFLEITGGGDKATLGSGRVMGVLPPEEPPPAFESTRDRVTDSRVELLLVIVSTFGSVFCFGSAG